MGGKEHAKLPSRNQKHGAAGWCILGIQLRVWLKSPHRDSGDTGEMEPGDKQLVTRFVHTRTISELMSPVSKELVG